MSTVRSMQSHGRAPVAWVLATLVLGVVFPGVARAADLRTGDTVVIGPQEVINDDLYVFAREVDIQGTVHGDVMTAARKVTLQGKVDGDVFSAAANTLVKGQVGGSLRSATNKLQMGAIVGKDALLAGNLMQLLPEGNIPGDLIIAGNLVDVRSQVGGNMRAASQMLTLGAPVKGTVNAEVNTLNFEDGARIGGDLSVTSEKAVQVPPGVVAGKVEQTRAHEASAGSVALGVLYLWVRSIVGLFALGLLLALLAPRLARSAPVVLRERPWQSLGWGVAAFVVAPIAASIVFAVGLVVGGWWLGVFVLGLYALALLASFPVVGMLIGRQLLEKFGRHGPSLVLALFTGIALLTLLRRVPYLGGLVAMVTMFFGMGALLLAIRGLRSTTTPVSAHA
ncbi:polymer-forming cytoskeletal protein [Pyxidicoccus parkwayensis]|uniref:Polymer-forming cytoskeletal protein n=1 Tax=Pyxidicoccus parkwayensis TaxID=2813578 RepID=A0ABX7NZ64_9BACT|nr:polymer-forming cytoskeletal protein [Pyxidicoccus parkwaysis]QSQ23649.1 polymer-forming cytoskeletal protein [Pyxidicoccus parkwaysis]